MLFVLPVNKGELDALMPSVEGQIDSLSNSQQLDMLRLQSLTNLLRGIPVDELRIASSSIQSIDFLDGQSLLVEGEIGTECNFIRTGNVQVSSRILVGNWVLLAELGPRGR